MLILSRRTDESFFIGDDIEITIFDIQSDRVRIGINAPDNVLILRKEIREIKEENVKASEAAPKEKLKSLNDFLASSAEFKSHLAANK